MRWKGPRHNELEAKKTVREQMELGAGTIERAVPLKAHTKLAKQLQGEARITGFANNRLTVG